jgi:putative endonuclease
MFYVYIVYSNSLGKFYVGSTENVSKRVEQHNIGKGNYTSKGIPWRLMHHFECASRSEAVQLEMKIKKRGIKRYLQDNDL